MKLLDILTASMQMTMTSRSVKKKHTKTHVIKSGMYMHSCVLKLIITTLMMKMMNDSSAMTARLNAATNNYLLFNDTN